jgi:hypothetical protein
MSENLPKKLPQKMSVGFGLSMINRALCEAFVDKERDSIHDVREGWSKFARTHHISGCAYCGDAQTSRWDHLIPVQKGGETVVGNMIPVCQSCDDSKQDKKFDEWLRSRAQKMWLEKKGKTVAKNYIESRIQVLNQFLKEHDAKCRSLVEKIPQTKRAQFDQIQSSLQQLRRDLEALGVLKKKNKGK